MNKTTGTHLRCGHWILATIIPAIPLIHSGRSADASSGPKINDNWVELYKRSPDRVRNTPCPVGGWRRHSIFINVLQTHCSRALRPHLSAAAPSQQPMVSQELTVSCVISQVGSTVLGSSMIEPGIYLISSALMGSPLTAVGPSSPVLIAQSAPGPIEGKQFIDLGIKADKGVLILDSTPTEFSIDPAGGNTFVVKVPSQDNVWTVSNPDPFAYSSTVELKGADGRDAQRWNFARLG
ncbi:hypothetical protein B0H19DRAFT_1070327 [Mycena capillaripes]|nr:hypothetical protein B0H19DRAFT_1070327 [Mycena capillaripes]